MKKIFFNLRSLMKEKGYNIKIINEQTNLSRTTVSNLLNHYSSGIQFDTLAQLCELLDCEPQDLLKLHKFNLEFEEENVSFMELVEKTKTDWGKEHIEFDINSKLSIDNQNFSFDFKVEAVFDYHKDNFDLVEFSPSKKLEYYITDKNIPNYIKEYFIKELKGYTEKIISTHL